MAAAPKTPLQKEQQLLAAAEATLAAAQQTVIYAQARVAAMQGTSPPPPPPPPPPPLPRPRRTPSWPGWPPGYDEANSQAAGFLLYPLNAFGFGAPMRITRLTVWQKDASRNLTA